MRVIMLTLLISLFCASLVSGGDKQDAAFDSLDADRDGKVTSREFETHFPGSSCSEAIAFSSEDDLNHDGVISLEEFAKKWKDSGADAVSFNLKDIDVNHDGVVTWKELQVHYPGVSKTGFNTADSNKDGFLNKKESLVLFRF